MKTASIADIRSRFSSYVKASKAEPVVVTRNDKPVAVIVGVSGEDEIERLVMAYSPRLNEILEASREQIRRGQTLSHDEFWAEVEAQRRSTQRGKKRKPA